MHRTTVILSLLLLPLSLPLYGAGKREASAESTQITIFSAASTTSLMEAVAENYEAERDVQIRMSPASSGTLARQIERGAEPDLYISASARWVEYVDSLGVVDRVAPFARNRLVLVAPEDSELSFVEIDQGVNLPTLATGLIAIADPGHAPAGMYAKSALEHFGWYEELRERLISAADVRGALALVELGEVDMGIVYETDALMSERVKTIGRFPEGSHPEIEYFCAVLETASKASVEFYNYLLEDREVGKILRVQGFSEID